MTARTTSWSASQLMATEFPEPKWAVPSLLAEGANLLVGSPKVGKSWWALGIALAVAAGGKALGQTSVQAGPVCYMALEDTGRRLQSRLGMLLDGAPAPDQLHLAIECERFPEGLDRIRAWHDENPAARLFVVDVLARVRPRTRDRDGLYEADYAAMAAIKSLAEERATSTLVLHHTRKAGSDDFLDSVSGTHGLAGAADAVLVLRRGRGTHDGVLKLTGRDVEDASHALSFNPTRGAWTLLDGSLDDYQLSETRRQILELVRAVGPMTPKAMADKLDLEAATARQTCKRMLEADQLDSDGQGHYWDPHIPPVTPVTPVTDSLLSDTSDASDSAHMGATR